MAKGKVAAKLPTVLELEPGDYYWCKCGESDNQPYCDGSHEGTGFKPVKFTIETKRKCALCNCKQTDNEPFCDGTHTTLPD